MPQPSDTSLAPADKRLLTIAEFKRDFGFGHTTTYELLNEGRIEAVKAGRKTLIVRDSAEAYVASLPRYREARAA